MAKVYITQIPSKIMPGTGQRVPTVNVGPATEHGELVVMMPASATIFDTREMIATLSQHLRHYSFEKKDSLIAIGDPAVIAVACWILGRMRKPFILLKWDRKMERYLPTQILPLPAELDPVFNDDLDDTVGNRKVV